MRKILLLVMSVVFSVCCFSEEVVAKEKNNFTDKIIKSLVYINVSSNEYSQFQPWRRNDISQDYGYGCAVSKMEVLTTAWNMLDAEYVKVLWAGQTQFVEAKVKFIDYESDLCLLELNKEAIKTELEPITFSDKYEKNQELGSYWITSTGTLITGRGYLDNAKVKNTTTSHTDVLHYIISNSSAKGSRGKLFCMDEKPVGIACWANDNEVRLIPGEKIKAFLEDCSDEQYAGFGATGFLAEQLIDPALRDYLKLTDDQDGGMLVSDVYTLGTGSDVLMKNDVILAIDGEELNAYGRYEDKKYGQIMYHHLITSKAKDDTIVFDVVRNGEVQSIEAAVKNFKASKMRVPWYGYSSQPEFAVMGGYIFQQLTRPYLRGFGDDIKGSVPPHLYNYLSKEAFKPTDEKSGIVILSYVLPTELSLGYHQLGRLVVTKCNGKEISSISDMLEAAKLNPDGKYDVIEFEQDQPTIVIDRTALPATNMMIQQRYGVSSLSNVN